MASLNQAFDTLKRLKTSIDKEKDGIVRAVDARIGERDKLEQERSQARELPRPREEVIEELMGVFERMHQDYLLRLGQRLNKFFDPRRNINHQEEILLNLLAPLTKPGDLAPTGFSSGTQSRDVVYDSIMGLFWPSIKSAVRQSLETMPYPTETGLPQKERQKKIEELTNKIGALNKEIRELLDKAEELGITFDEN